MAGRAGGHSDGAMRVQRQWRRGARTVAVPRAAALTEALQDQEVDPAAVHPWAADPWAGRQLPPCTSNLRCGHARTYGHKGKLFFEETTALVSRHAWRREARPRFWYVWWCVLISIDGFMMCW